MAVFEQKVSNYVTLDDTLPLTGVIENAQNVKDHTEYTIRVRRGILDDNSWIICKRYSDFVTLNDSLKAACIDLPIPPKKVFGKMEREFIAERQMGLQTYINILLSHKILANALVTKQFFDMQNYDLNLREIALQNISMFFRSEPRWEVLEAAPDIGWRIRKQYFFVKDKNNPKNKQILSWCQFGPEKTLPDKDLTAIITQFPTVQHPHIWPVSFASSNDTCALCIRPFSEKGTLRDLIHKTKPKGQYLKKYSKLKCLEMSETDIRLYGKQILSTLQLLHEKGYAYGHLHSGNVIVENRTCYLLDMENWFIGVPSYYRAFFIDLRKINTWEAIDVYSFGHLLYEMVFGEELESPTCDTFPPMKSLQTRSVLESILTTESCKKGIPTISDLLQHDLFRDVLLPPTDRPQLRLSSKVKKSVEDARTALEGRLKEEQKQIYQKKKVSKAQAFHMSDAEIKKRRRSKLKSQRSTIENGEDAEQSAPAEPSVPVSPTTNDNDGNMSGSSVSAAPTVAPVAPPPPPPTAPATTEPSLDTEPRSALLGSIQGFDKTGLKRSVTVDKSGPKI